MMCLMLLNAMTINQMMLIKKMIGKLKNAIESRSHALVHLRCKKSAVSPHASPQYLSHGNQFYPSVNLSPHLSPQSKCGIQWHAAAAAFSEPTLVFLRVEIV